MSEQNSFGRRKFIKIIGSGLTALGFGALIPDTNALKLTSNTVSGADINNREIEAKVINGTVYAGHGDFSTVQDAIDFANNNGYYEVEVPPGSYDSISIPGGISVKGVSSVSNDASKAPHFEVSSGPAITLGYQSKISTVFAKTSDSSSYSIDTQKSNKTVIENVWVNHPDGNNLRMNGHNGRVYGCEFAGGSILLDSSSANITITGCGSNVSITNNGAGNVSSGIS